MAFCDVNKVYVAYIKLHCFVLKYKLNLPLSRVSMRRTRHSESDVVILVYNFMCQLFQCILVQVIPILERMLFTDSSCPCICFLFTDNVRCEPGSHSPCRDVTAT